MCNKLIKIILDEFANTVAEQISNNNKGLDEIGTEYWFGRISDSEEIKKKTNKIIEKYYN
ncbi:hypothetical protein [Anaerovorax odorimutans]|uniref:hypothetical protein n=1 Tax=Anaerovorax odorimutans TaxID=109327 RepID=UPI00041923B9|nr:hypothetical protein [Anaerovorax odorimutans]